MAGRQAAGPVKPAVDAAEPASLAGQPQAGAIAPSERTFPRFAPSITAVLRGPFGEALWLFVTLRVVLSLFAFLASLYTELPGPCSWEGGPQLHTTGADFRLLGLWQRWDACWYGKIATEGYQPGDPSIAFFPLFPALMYLAGLPFGNNWTLGGLLVSGVAYIMAMAGLGKLVRSDFDWETGRRTMLYVSIFPVAFFFFAPFTESLFLALAVWTIYFVRQGRWEQAALPALFVGLTRTQGCLLVLPLAWELLRQWRQRPPDVCRRFHLTDLGRALVCLLPLVGFGLFLAFSQVVAGWTTFEAQAQWGRTSRAPWSAVAISWRHILERRDVFEGLNLGSLLICSALVLLSARRLPFAYTLYALPQLLLVSSRQNFFSPLMSTSRYVLVIFPVFVVLALGGRYRRLHYSWMLLSLLLLGFFLYAFLTGAFVA